MTASRGFTLLETTIVAAIVALLAVALASAGVHQPAGAQTAVAQFDAAVAAARTLAANVTNGSTLVITSSANTTALRVYDGRPTSASALVYSGVPDAALNASISETHAQPPMSIFFNSAGAASETSGAVTIGSIIAADPGCPGSATSLVLTISDARASVTRTLPCR